MQIYLVGGAVRDKLLNLPITERDWVVVGATPEQLIQQGYQQVGNHFPVFLHPKTNEEYALARTESKTGHGYQGFSFQFSPYITLEEDLQRRDLTINAMAMDDKGHIIDPYHGQMDLAEKILRHVSNAFIEDPLRVLRVARFYARFYDLGFKIAPNTLALMKKLVDSKELNYLSAERLWMEWTKALQTKHPEQFFLCLNDCGALDTLFPELIDQDFKAFSKLASNTQNINHRYILLCKNLTVQRFQSLAKRLKIPKNLSELGIKFINHAKKITNLTQKTSHQILEVLQHLDAFRQTQLAEDFFECTRVNQFISEHEKNALMHLLEDCKSIRITPELIQKNDVSAIKNYFNEQRINFINHMLMNLKPFS
jgi:tRNA nucleotidyltransferase (CCA-adding enzyme)